MPRISDFSAEAELIRRKLTQLKLQYEKTIFDLEYFLERPPSPEEVSKKLFPEKNEPKAAAPQLMTFNQFIHAEMIKITRELQARGIALNKNNLASSYAQTLRLLNAFNQNRHLSFTDIHQSFYARLLQYCTEVRQFKPNNIGKHIRNIKALMNKALKQGLHDNPAFRHFSKPVENVDTIYLDTAEIASIAALEFSNENAHLESTRDLFIIACWTGLRYGDWGQFASLDLTGSFVTITAQKTGKPIVIPLHPQVISIAARYNYKLPQPKHNVVFNRDLKEIGRLAGLNEWVEFQETTGGVRRRRRVEKFRLITCHTARRSFATNLYNMGVSAIDIMQITGHKTESVFMKYIRISRQEAAARILDKFQAQ